MIMFLLMFSSNRHLKKMKKRSEFAVSVVRVGLSEYLLKQTKVVMSQERTSGSLVLWITKHDVQLYHVVLNSYR